MATYRIVNTLHSTSGMVEDDVINTFHFTTTEPSHTGTVGALLNGHVAAAFESTPGFGSIKISTAISPEISRSTLPTVRAYNVAGGSPVATSTWAGMSAAIAGGALPSETAVCLSYNASLVGIPEEAADDADADSAPERPASRRRGRVFIGPLVNSASLVAGTPLRPVLDFRNSLLSFGEFLASPTDVGLTAVSATWVINSSSGFAGATYPIIRCSVDDALDSQRRRGRAATVRNYLAVP